MDPLNNDKKTRDATADIIRNRIDQIFSSKNPNSSQKGNSSTLPQRQASRPMIEQNPYLPNISKTEKPQPKSASVPRKNPESRGAINHKLEIADTKKAHELYHNSWQRYYQKYYERYYVGAVEQQNRDFNQKLSEISNSPKPINDDFRSSIEQKIVTQELRDDLRTKIRSGAQKAQKSRHFVPIICAIVMIFVALFIQYNQLLFGQINSFISPGAMTDQTIIIGTGEGQPVGPEPRLIIPKLNINVEIVFNVPDLSEEGVQAALLNGPVHYPIQGASAFPGQNGNTVILGHSAADIFVPSRYRFIFVQLNRLVEGDIFYINYEGVRYTYRISGREIVYPHQVYKLAIGNDRPRATIVTCDPPGSAARRLLVFADQISPDPNQATANQDDNIPVVSGEIVGSPPTLFERLFRRR